MIYKKDECIAALRKLVRRTSTIQVFTMNSEMSKAIEHVKELPCVEECFKAPSGDSKENDIRRLVVSATTIAAKQGILAIPKDPLAIASTVDQGFGYAKLAYKVAVGEIEVADVIDRLIDATAVRISAAVPTIVNKGLDLAINCVTAICPPARAYAPIMKSVASRLSAPLCVAVQGAINKVSNSAKSAVRNMLSGITKVSLVGKIKNRIKR